MTRMQQSRVRAQKDEWDCTKVNVVYDAEMNTCRAKRDDGTEWYTVPCHEHCDKIESS
jgi:hypothetical protein